jgi:tetratricopeptide (TPR) repeat protein/predicted Ser/Thr protein kinase
MEEKGGGEERYSRNAAQAACIRAAWPVENSYTRSRVPFPHPLMSLEPGSRIGRIRIDGLIGAGGMGEVYRGWDERLERRVAVKVIQPPKLVHETIRVRFLREAQLLSKLDHPNICRIYDVIEDESGSYLVLELIEGRTLRDAFPEIDAAAAVRVAETVARVLAFAHERNIIHRDLKPDNIMLTATGEVKVLDFGLARLVQQDEELPPVAAREDDKTVLIDPAVTAKMTSIDWARTSAGTLVGTLHYMSPEQARGLPLTAASDVYSLGIVFYELLRRGRSPYGSAPSSTDLLAKVRRADVELSGLDDGDVTRLIGRLTASDPAQRPTAADTARELGRIASRPARRRRNAMIAAGAALVVVLVAAMLVLAYRAAERPLFTTPGERKIAVLPFRNETKQRGNEWMELGLMDMVMQGLGGARTVELVAAEDVLKALKNANVPRGAEITPQVRARLLDALGADTLLAAVVRTDGGSAKFRIGYRLLLRDREEAPREVEAAAVTDAANELAARVARRVDPKAHSVDIRDRYSFDDFANVAYAIGMQEMLGKGPRAAAHYFTVCLDRDAEFAWAKLQLARCRIVGGEPAGVNELLDDAERQARGKGDRKLVSAVINARSENAVDRGDYDAAERFARASLATASTLGDLHLLARAQRTLGIVAWRRQRLDEAERWHLAAGQTFTRTRNVAEQARIYNNLGVLALERKDLEKATVHFTRALPLAERLSDRVLTSKIVGNLGLMSLYRGDPAAGKRYMRRELALAHSYGNRTDELNALLNLGIAEYMQGNEAEAIAMTERGRDLAVSMRIPFAEAIACANLGFAHTAAGRLGAADRELDRADAIRAKLGSPQVDHLAGTMRAYWLVRTGDLAAADRTLASAERLWKSKNTHAIRARLLYEQGDYRAAAEAIHRASALRELWMPTDQRLLEAIEDAARTGKPATRAFEAAAQG